VSFSVRLFLGYFLLVGLAGWFFLQSFVAELTPGMRQSIEEVLVDMANLLAERVEREVAAGEIGEGEFAAEFSRFATRRFEATIWSLKKMQPSLTVYVTNADGVVVFDSRDGRDLGADYGRWNDVYLTLQGRYGARTTRSDPNDPLSSVMYVAAPIRYAGRIIGVLTVGKPSITIMPFVEAAERNLKEQGLWLLLASLAVGLLMTLWLTGSIRRLIRYASEVRAGRRVRPPRLRERELAALADAMEAMRGELEGREYVERYLHSLTHELKSPLTAIRGAAELLDEDMPLTARRRFLGNIRAEVERLQRIVDRLLGLAALEKRQGLEQVESLDPAALVKGLAESKRTLVLARRLCLDIELKHEGSIHGERFLLEQAVSNLIDNAIEFSPEGGTISIRSGIENGRWCLEVVDQGPGVPDYALPHVFDRFYSQPRPDGDRKGTGLGLSLVREVAQLHGGDIILENGVSGGARSVLCLPLVRRQLV